MRGLDVFFVVSVNEPLKNSRAPGDLRRYDAYVNVS